MQGTATAKPFYQLSLYKIFILVFWVFLIRLLLIKWNQWRAYVKG